MTADDADSAVASGVTSDVAGDTCPRCGGGFHCGVADGLACPCGTLDLSAALLARLRQQYSQCLCLRCLAALATEDRLQAATP